MYFTKPPYVVGTHIINSVWMRELDKCCMSLSIKDITTRTRWSRILNLHLCNTGTSVLTSGPHYKAFGRHFIFLCMLHTSFLINWVFSESSANACLCWSNIQFRNEWTEESFCSCKAEDKSLNLSEPSKVKDILENLVTKLRPLADEDNFGLQTLFPLIGMCYISVLMVYTF